MVVAVRSTSSTRPRAVGRGAGPKKESREDDVRGRVLDAAVKLIDEGGLAGVSMREVARAAGVSHQAPYHYFADREAIFAALAEEGFKTLTARLESNDDPREPADDRFVCAGQTYVEFAFDHPALFRIMFRPDLVAMDRFPEASACGDRAFQVLPALVQACIDEGLPAEPSVQALIILAWSVPHGLACLVLDGPLPKKFPDLLENRAALTRDVMTAMRNLLEASSAGKAAKKRGAKTSAKTSAAAKPAKNAAPRRRTR
jgi:AcrR family transcriptional regulator